MKVRDRQRNITLVKKGKKQLNSEKEGRKVPKDKRWKGRGVKRRRE
jgi:hypothetical protein